MEEVKKVPDEETGGGRQNTMKILDKREEAWEEKKKSDGWNGYHVLFTETTQFLIIWEDMKKKLKIAYFATLAFLILFVVCLGGAGIWNFIESALLSAVVPIIYGLFCRDDIYLKVFDPARDQGALYLPEEMTWEEAVDVIRRGLQRQKQSKSQIQRTQWCSTAKSTEHIRFRIQKMVSNSVF